MKTKNTNNTRMAIFSTPDRMFHGTRKNIYRRRVADKFEAYKMAEKFNWSFEGFED